MLKIKIILFCLVIFFSSSSVLKSEIIEGVGEYVHTVRTSQLESCNNAKQNAIKDAASKLVGETIRSESTKICESSLEKSQCELYQNTFSIIDSVVQLGKPKIISEEIIQKSNYEICQVKIKVDLKPLPKSDKNFDFDIALNNQKFVADFIPDSDDIGLKVSIRPQNGKKMYINVFHWAPYEEGKNIQKIFPRNSSDKNLINSEIILPNKKGVYYRPIFPKNTNFNSLVEGIHVFASDEDIQFNSNYTYNNFQKKLIEVSGPQTRSKNTMYVVIKK